MLQEIRRFFSKKPVPLAPEASLVLRDLAGWPLQQHQEGGYRHRHREMTIQRDEFGRIIGSLEHVEEDEYEQYSDTWGK